MNIFTGFIIDYDDGGRIIFSDWEYAKEAFEAGKRLSLFRPCFAWETGGDVYKPVLRDGEAPFAGALRLIGETLDGDDLPVFEEYSNGGWKPFNYLFLIDYAEGTEKAFGFCRTK